MTIKNLDYWYDASIRRFLEQIVRAFSGFQYQTGVNASGQTSLVMVPCHMAQTNTMVASIMQNGSDNVLLSVPMITVYMTGIAGRRGDVLNQMHVDSKMVTERAIDAASGKYTNEIGRRYTIDRLMPRPFELDINVDIWTSNQDQKLQLFEQMLTIFYPDIQIQNSENALDWGAMTQMTLEDIVWSSRSIPIGSATSSSNLDIGTLRLKCPFWLSPPAKVKSQKIIEQVITNINSVPRGSDMSSIEQGTYLTRSIVTPGNYDIFVQGNIITLLGSKSSPIDFEDGKSEYSWSDLIPLYGELNPTVSTIHLKQSSNLDDRVDDIIGTIQYDPNNPNQLIWTLDPTTLPHNTQDPVDAVIDPTRTWPGQSLPVAAIGQRYLVLESITAPTQAWGNLQTNENDIISYDGSNWFVAHRPVIEDKITPDYVLNSYTGTQLKWDGHNYILSVGGYYNAGFWRLKL